MNKYLFTTFLLYLGLTNEVLSQELQFTIGKRFESARSNVIRVNSTVFYEDNLNSQYYPIGINLKVPFRNRFSIVSGIQFYRPATGFTVYKDTVCSLCPVLKATTIGHPTLEFPLNVTFNLFKSGKWQASVLGGITPALRLGISDSKYLGPVNPPGWDEDVIAVLNTSSSTVKMTYVNYMYGFQFQYARFGILTYWQQNLSRNIANPLDVGGKKYPFVKQIECLQLSLTYTFLKFNKAD